MLFIGTAGVVEQGDDMGNHFFFVDTPWSTGTRPVGKTVDPFGVEAIDSLKHSLFIDVAEESHFQLIEAGIFKVWLNDGASDSL